MQSLINDSTSALLRALRKMLGDFQSVTFERIKSRSWASATFAGARHEISMLLNGDGAEGAAERLAQGIGEAELELRGHIVADIALVSREVVPDEIVGPQVRVRIEALTVEED